MDKMHNPHVFAVGLKDACCKEPCCCLGSAIGSPCGFTACYMRKAVLDKYHNGIEDFICCQGYVGACCCIDFKGCLPGSACGLCLEGCCCPIFSLSIARIHLMDKKQIRPDPCDWQIIWCSNCLQLLACILDIVAIFVDEAREAAQIVNCIADLVTFSVAGCMGAQIHHEIKKDKDQVTYIVAEGVPVGQPAHQPHVRGAPPVEEMDR